MNITPERLKLITEIGSLQMVVQDTVGHPLRENPIHFKWKGFAITHPTEDESTSKKVDPVAYYGDAFIKSPFMTTPIEELRRIHEWCAFYHKAATTV